MSKKSALVVIDVQVNVVKDAYNRDRVLDNIRTLLARARASGTPVVYVQHESREGDGLEAGTPGWEIHPAVSPRPGEPVVQKHACDSFHQTSLQQELEKHGIEHLVVVGAQTDYCVGTSVRRATTCGYDVTLVVDAMLPYLTTHFGNPSSSHFYASAPRRAIETARAQVAGLLACQPSEIIFTGGGSESDALAIRGVALALRSRGNHIITQQTEHPAVKETCRQLEHLYGFHVTYLPVDQDGRVIPASLEAAITDQTVLVSIMLANNETGTLQPISELVRMAHRSHILFHTDAAQAVGKISTSVPELGVDLLTVAGHKLYAPKGVGTLYVRSGVQLAPLITGGGQEHGLRAGTENVAALVALGMACQLAGQTLAEDQARFVSLRDLLLQRLCEYLPDLLQLNGHPTERLPNTLNTSIEGIIGEEVLARTPGIAAATGSACHAGSTSPSEVLLAMGMQRTRALGALRLTLGRWSTAEEVEQAAQMLAQTVHRLRERT